MTGGGVCKKLNEKRKIYCVVKTNSLTLFTLLGFNSIDKVKIIKFIRPLPIG
jgi:hypothetical protein